MLFVSFIEDFNQKEGILKASHTKEKITTLFPSKPSFSLKSSSYPFIFFFFKDTKSIGNNLGIPFLHKHGFYFKLC